MNKRTCFCDKDDSLVDFGLVTADILTAPCNFDSLLSLVHNQTTGL